jgi:hypothetical protein
LSDREIAAALDAGAASARAVLAAGLIEGAALRLQGETVVVGTKAIRMAETETVFHNGVIESAMHA